MSKFKKFLTIGALSISTAYGSSVLTNDFNDDYVSNMLSKIQTNEQQHIDFKVNTTEYMEAYSGIRDGEYLINMGKGTTNLLKIFAPIEHLKTDGNGTHTLVALHEYSHIVLSETLKNEKEVFNINLNDTDNEKINFMISNYMKKKPHSLISKNFHENFADAYGSVLMIRNLDKTYSDQEIKQIIQARYQQVHTQSNMLWGSFGDIDHRTDSSLHEILNTPFENIRAMTSEESKKFALNVASKGSIKQLSGVFQNSIINNSSFKNNLTQKDIEHFSAFVHSKNVSPIDKSQPETVSINSKSTISNKISQLRKNAYSQDKNNSNGLTNPKV